VDGEQDLMSDTPLPFIPFSKPTISEAAIEEVVACLRSGWITSGPRMQLFEDMLTEYHEGRRALCMSSATAGLHAALLTLGMEGDNEVITTPLTFVATLNTIVLAGGKPVLVDIDPKTLNINVDKIERAITPRTRAIMPVHFAGLPADLDPIYAIAKKHGLRVIEDCAHAIGASYKGKRIGTFGDLQVMSFHPNKNITTGEGGAVITDSIDTAYAIECMRFHGIDRTAAERMGKVGSQYYDVVGPGYKYNLTDMQASLGIHQLPELGKYIEARTRMVKRYMEAFADWPDLILPATPDYEHTHAWHLFTPRLSDKATVGRDWLIEAMKRENIGVGLHYQAAHVFSWYRRQFGWQPGDMPNALQAGERIFSLPLFPTMTDEEQERVIKTLEKLLHTR
jgi:dTDP-4-amino-4,6-dideoxygalactose transaminase